MLSRIFWGVGLVAVVVAVTAFAAVSARRLGPQEPPRGALAEALSDRVATLMETRFRTVTTAQDVPVRCAARSFGARPEGLTEAAEATTIYAWVYCRAAAGSPHSLLAPVAVRLDGRPAVRVPARGDDRQRSLRRIFPADVREAMHRTDTAALTAGVTGAR